MPVTGQLLSCCALLTAPAASLLPPPCRRRRPPPRLAALPSRAAWLLPLGADLPWGRLQGALLPKGGGWEVLAPLQVCFGIQVHLPQLQAGNVAKRQLAGEV